MLSGGTLKSARRGRGCKKAPQQRTLLGTLAGFIAFRGVVGLGGGLAVGGPGEVGPDLEAVTRGAVVTSGWGWRQSICHQITAKNSIAYGTQHAESSHDEEHCERG